MQQLLISKKFWISLVLFVWIGLFFCRQTNLAASDLGRHIKNGQVILETGGVFHTNLYSYTNPDFPAPNHHWLFGVIAFAVHQVSGFAGLTIMGAFLYTGAIALVFYYSYRRSSFFAAVTATVLAIPLLADRSETRPEAFSLFFFAALFCLFGWLVSGKLQKYFRYLVITTGLLMAVWINIHIFFVLTGILVLAALIHAVGNKNHKTIKPISLLSVSLLLGAFINPLGITLLLYPLQIFENYGYRVSENQTLWFFLQQYTRPIHWYLLFFMIVTLLVIWQVAKTKLSSSLYHLVIVIFFLIFTFRLIRMENIFALTALPILSVFINQWWSAHGKSIRQSLGSTQGMMISSIIGFSLISAAVGSGLFIPITYGMGVGLLPDYNQSIDFVKNLPNTGPIFNNFDSGSFLIYSLYPHNKVFIDNRAEAYPSSFIQDSYLRPQENDGDWTQLEEHYHFSSIIFYRHEQTNWGQEFLVKRIQDSTWKPIYVDDYLIIFLKDIPANKQLIEQYQLPSEMFSVSQN